MIAAGSSFLAPVMEAQRPAPRRASGVGDGGPAVRADVYPSAIALDTAGNVYITEKDSGRVRKVGTDGVITTVAGARNPTGQVGGDGGAAIRALLSGPSGVAVDSAGAFYITDVVGVESITGARVRRVGPDGIITTIAGGTPGFSGDGGPAAAARFGWPTGIAIDSRGAIYIADIVAHRVRMIGPTGAVSTVAGDGTLGFSGDGGPATMARLSGPCAVAVDGSGNLYIADPGNGNIRMVSARGTISTVAGFHGARRRDDAGPAADTLSNPRAIAVGQDGALYIGDTGHHRVLKVSPTGTMTTVAGTGALGHSGDGGRATGATFFWITGVATDRLGNIYIADLYNRRVRRVAPNGVITSVAGNRAPTPPEEP
jgi:sugar lactone lactonase YvrE